MTGVQTCALPISGNTWSDVQIILGSGTVPALRKNLSNPKLSKLNNNRLLLNFNRGANNPQSILYYRISNDNGLTWGDTVYSIKRNGLYYFEDQTIIEISQDTLFCVFKLRSSAFGANSDIYARFSTDNGVTWGDTVKIAGNELNETTPRITKDKSGTIWLAYLRADTIKFAGLQYEKFINNNIFYKTSSNGGLSWSEEMQFTYYIGDDKFLSISANTGEPFISYSTPKFTFNNQIAIGYLNKTIETYTPPVLFKHNDVQLRDSLLFLAYVKDDNEVENVELVFDSSGTKMTLYDDGDHGDNNAGDGIYGNRMLTPPVSYNKNSIYINSNKMKIPFLNNGIIALVTGRDTIDATFNLSDVDNNFSAVPKNVIIQFPSGGQYDEGTFLFSSGFFLSGFSNGELWANGVAPSSLIEDYQAGNVGSNPNDSKFYFYVVQKDDPPFGSSWIKWKDAVELGADFYDGDGDGIYNPVDKNWNGTWDINEDMPALLGDVTAWCVYNDGVPDSLRRLEVEPQGIEIRQTVFNSSLPELENVMFIKYSILNTGTVDNEMDSVYLGIWEDADLGAYDDDLVGCDTLLNSGFAYNNTPDFIYGENCPSFFTTLLQGPIIQTNDPSDTAIVKYGGLISSESFPGSRNLDISSHAFNLGGDPYIGDPGTVIQVRNYLEGKTRTGFYPNPCTFMHGEVRGGVDCNEVDPHFWASGDPVTDVGWINISNSDQRNFVNSGPFKLEKDKPQEIIIAYVMGRGTDFFNSITVARENVQRAIQEYENNFTSMTYSPPPPVNPVTDYKLYHNYPNPFNPTTTIRFELPQDGIVTIKVYDILGQEVATILNEFKKADRYEIKFNAKGLASGVYIYRMKVNDFIESKKMVVLK